MDKFYEKLKELNNYWVIEIFGLYTTEDELKKRLDMRKDNQFKDFITSRKINQDTLNYKQIEVYLIDTTFIEANITAKIIYKNLKK